MFTRIARNEFLKLENLWATILSVPRDGMPLAIAFLAFRPTTRPRSRIGNRDTATSIKRNIFLSSNVHKLQDLYTYALLNGRLGNVCRYNGQESDAIFPPVDSEPKLFQAPRLDGRKPRKLSFADSEKIII